MEYGGGELTGATEGTATIAGEVSTPNEWAGVRDLCRGTGGIFPPRVSGTRDRAVHEHQTSACRRAETSVAVPPLPSEQLPLIVLPLPGPVACRKTFVQYGTNSAESFPVPPQVPTTVRHPIICNRDRLLPLE